MSRVSSCAMVVVVWLKGREEEEWCLGLSGGYDCDMAICRNLASPKRRLMVGLRCSWSLRLSPGGFECSCCTIRQTSE
jgi:hypothetical protein